MAQGMQRLAGDRGRARGAHAAHARRLGVRPCHNAFNCPSQLRSWTNSVFRYGRADWSWAHSTRRHRRGQHGRGGIPLCDPSTGTSACYPPTKPPFVGHNCKLINRRAQHAARSSEGQHSIHIAVPAGLHRINECLESDTIVVRDRDGLSRRQRRRRTR